METTLNQRIEGDHKALVQELAVARTNLLNHRRMLMHTVLFGTPMAGPPQGMQLPPGVAPPGAQGGIPVTTATVVMGNPA